MNYYNEIEPFARNWLANLMDAELIPAGHIDSRPIQEVTADDVRHFEQAHFFAGIAGWPEALRLAGWTGPCWTGSCPCQPFSAAGKRKGTADERHLWPEFFRLIKECKPPVIFGEQVASKDGLAWLDGVFADLEGAGYACGAADMCAAGFDAPHIRQRLYWVAESENCGHLRRQDAKSDTRGQCEVSEAQERLTGPRELKRDMPVGRVADAGSAEQRRLSSDERKGVSATGGRGQNGRLANSDGRWWPCSDGKSRRVGTGVQPLAHGIPVSLGRGRSKSERMAIRAARTNRVGRLRGYGNAIVPQVAAAWIEAVMEYNK